MNNPVSGRRRKMVLLLVIAAVLLAAVAAVLLIVKGPAKGAGPDESSGLIPNPATAGTQTDGSTTGSAPLPVTHDLSGVVICLDPAHASNPDTDKEPVGPGSDNTKAKDPAGIKGVSSGMDDFKITLAIANDLKSQLEAQGADVVMTREGDTFDGGGRDRARVANEAGADLLLVVDVSAAEDQSVQGVSTVHPALVYGWTDDIYKKSNTAALMIQSAMVKMLGTTNQWSSESSDYPEFNWSNSPVVLAKVGYLTNPDEDQKLASSDYQQQVAAALLAGIDDYFTK